MRVYIYDLEFGGRKWSDLVRPWSFESWNPEDDSTIRGDVLICHSRFVGDEVSVAALKAAARGVVVILVSGGALTGRVESGIYRRRAGVDKPRDDSFNAAFGRFARHLEKHGEARWDLLEPLVAPESLLAYYLCVLAGMEELAAHSTDGKTLREAARVDCDQLLTSLADAGLPPVGCELSPENIQRILRVI